jgi:IMP dehydrogenase
MRFLSSVIPPYDLTYNDVFMVPQKTEILSRFHVDLKTPDNVGTIPIVVANMTAVAGKRMAETVARRGGIAVIPQDVPLKVVKNIVNAVGDAHTIFETPITLKRENTIGEGLSLINKRAHGAVIVVDEANKPIGIFTEKDADGYDRFAALDLVMTKNILSLQDDATTTEMHTFLNTHRLSVAPVVNKKGALIGVMTAKSCLRSEIYTPNVDVKKKLRIAAAIGINGDVAEKARQLLDLGIEILVLDTAHGHQQKMIDAIKIVRKLAPKTTIVAGNVVTAEATKDLINAGATIVKVGVGPGAMCTTRMMTGVGRPQFSAVYECSEQAKKMGAHVWADGGIRYPRDVALALAAGASNVMFASWLAGTYESAADMMQDENGKLFKESFGMASQRAVRNRNQTDVELEKAKKELFEEGISSSKFLIDAKRPGVEDIIDQIIAGVRSACTYAGATSISELQEKAVVGVQSASGYQEGMPLASNW